MAHILLIEDEIHLAKISDRFLSLAGHQVTLASNGREALDLLEKGERYDLAICDLSMPICDGFQFLEELKVMNLPLKVVISSAYMGDKRYIERCRDFPNYTGHLDKPYTRAQIVKKAEESLG